MYASAVIIGAGQAGLSAAYHLSRRGFSSALDQGFGEPTFVVLDAEEAAGGAWQHRWEDLRVNTLNAIFDLPDFSKPDLDPFEPSSLAVPRYFGEFEAALGLPILRPVTVTSVARADGDPGGDLLVATSAGTWRTRAIINASGTWNNPIWPTYPGAQSFAGRQLHTRDYSSLEDFAGLHVGIVGGGISALQHLEEVSRVARTFWYTRREPVFIDGSFTPEVEGRATIAKVVADVEEGRPTGSVVSYTGLGWSDYAIAARERGVLVRRPMFTQVEPYGVREADGSFTSLDVILWATGFKADLSHLEPLGLRNELGGIRMRGTQVAAEPRVHLIGFGPSRSTVGANRAGREAAAAIRRMMVPADPARL